MSNLALVLLAVPAALAAGGALGWWVNNRLGRNSLEAVKRRSEEILHNARRDAEKSKRTALVEAREEIFRQRNKADNDLRSRKGQLLKRERDLIL